MRFYDLIINNIINIKFAYFFEKAVQDVLQKIHLKRSQSHLHHF